MIPSRTQTPTTGAVQRSEFSYGASSMSRIGIVTPPITASTAGIIAITPRIGTTRCLSGLNSSALAQEVADAGEVHEDVHPGKEQPDGVPSQM